MPQFGDRGEPIWTEDELELDRQISIQQFVEARLSEHSEPYLQWYSKLNKTVERLFFLTNDLQKLNGEVICQHPDLIDAIRYLTGPPISADDLNTLSGGNLLRQHIDENVAHSAAQIILKFIDPYRFPWVIEKRPPTPQERKRAIQWTTGLWCVQRVHTSRRMEASFQQQKKLMDYLVSKGWERKDIRVINALEDLPVGTFAPECILGGVKCDIPIRLHNRMLVAAECKVSNSSINSVKRLNRETGEKAKQWREYFGRQVIPVAVISGVFNLVNLKHAQDEQKITLIWEHNIEALSSILEAR